VRVGRWVPQDGRQVSSRRCQGKWQNVTDTLFSALFSAFVIIFKENSICVNCGIRVLARLRIRWPIGSVVAQSVTIEPHFEFIVTRVSPRPDCSKHLIFKQSEIARPSDATNLSDDQWFSMKLTWIFAENW
jgi:hypothetical protein